MLTQPEAPAMELPHAVPPLDLNADEMVRHIGLLTLRVKQLERLLVERAEETNRLHDELQAMSGTSKPKDS